MKKCKITVLLILSVFLIGCASYAEKGTDLLEEEKYEEAAEKFQKGIEKNKDLAENYRGLGLAYWELGDYENAEKAFQSALENEAEGTGALYNLMGLCNMELEDYEGALNYFRLGIASEDAGEKLIQEMEYNEIVAYENLRDWETAKHKMEQYIEKYPDDEKAAKEAAFLRTR